MLWHLRALVKVHYIFSKCIILTFYYVNTSFLIWNIFGGSMNLHISSKMTQHADDTKMQIFGMQSEYLDAHNPVLG